MHNRFLLLLNQATTSPPSAIPTFSVTGTFGQGAVVTPVAGSNPGAVLTEWRYYFDDVIDAARTGDSSATLTLNDVQQTLTVSAYYAAFDIELFSEPQFVPFIGAELAAIDEYATTLTLALAARAPGDTAPGDGVTYDYLVFLNAVAVSMTSDANLGINAASYVPAPILGKFVPGYAVQIITHYGSHTKSGSVVSLTWKPVLRLDLFAATVAAGAINGTPSTGGETRFSTDTESKASQGSGELTFSGAKSTSPTFNDPSIGYPALARTEKRPHLIDFKLLSASVLDAFKFGLLNVTTPASAGGAMFKSGVALFHFEQASGTRSFLENITTGVRKKVAIIERTTGAHFLGHDGTRWLLLYPYPQLTTEPNYFLAGTANAAYSLLSPLFIPDELYAIVVTVSDGMSGANSDGAGHVDNATVPGGSGFSRTSVLGTWGVSGGKLSTSALDGGAGVSVITYDGSLLDIIALIAFTYSSTDAAKWVEINTRYVDENNRYYVRFYNDGAASKLVAGKVVGGVDTPSGSVVSMTGGSAYSANAHIGIRAIGTQFTSYYRDISKVQDITVADAALQTSTLVAIRTNDTAATFDNFELWNVGTDDAYSGFAKYRDAFDTTVTIPVPGDDTPYSMPTNPGGADIAALIAAAGAGGTVTLTANGIYTMAHAGSGYDLTFPTGITLTVSGTVDRVIITGDDGNPLSLIFNADVQIPSPKVWFAGTRYGNTNIAAFNAGGGQVISATFVGYEGIVVGTGKADMIFANGASIRMGTQGDGGSGGNHGIYLSGGDIGEAKNALVQGWLFLFGSRAGLRIGHGADIVEAHGNFFDRNSWNLAAGDSTNITLTDNAFWENSITDYVSADGLVMTGNIIGAGDRWSNPSGGTVTGNISVLASKIAADSSPVIWSDADVVSNTGYSRQVWDAILDLLETKFTTIDATLYADSTVDYYLGLLRTAFTVPYVP